MALNDIATSKVCKARINTCCLSSPLHSIHCSIFDSLPCAVWYSSEKDRCGPCPHRVYTWWGNNKNKTITAQGDEQNGRGKHKMLKEYTEGYQTQAWKSVKSSQNIFYLSRHYRINRNFLSEQKVWGGVGLEKMRIAGKNSQVWENTVYEIWRQEGTAPWKCCVCMEPILLLCSHFLSPPFCFPISLALSMSPNLNLYLRHWTFLTGRGNCTPLEKQWTWCLWMPRNLWTWPASSICCGQIFYRLSYPSTSCG